MALSLAIYDILRANANVLSTFATRIYPVVIPIGETTPAITYTITNHNQDLAKDDPDGYDEISLRVGVYASTYTLAETYHNYVYTALQNYAATVQSEKILHINCTNRRTDDIAEMYWKAETSGGQYCFVIYMDFQILRG